MHIAAIDLTSRPRRTAGPAALPDVLRQSRRLLLASLGCAALAAALAGDVLAVLAGGARTNLLAVCLLSQVPVLAVVMLGCWSPGRGFRTPLGSLVESGSRAARAEQALAREHDRVHQLRATLAGVSAWHRLLNDPHLDLAAPRRRRMQRMYAAELERLERLLGDREERTATVDLDAVIAPLAEASAVLGSPVTWTGAGCSVVGRPDDVAEALHVLLANAARHAAGQGVEIRVVRRDGEVDVCVTDHGPGVAPEVRSGLFQRRVRGSGSPGEGIGLDIARRLAEEMGGRLRLAAPDPGESGETGATFVLTLPAASGATECLAVPS